MIAKTGIKFIISLTYLLFVACLISISSSCKQDDKNGVEIIQEVTPQNYYIDAVSGNDLNNGTSSGSAWQTFTKVNERTFIAGNQILLKTGCVWNQQLKPKGSGSPTSPIILGSYGIGNKPIINGQGVSGAVVYLKNQSNWIIQNLEITNYASERSYIYRWGINIENYDAGTLRNIQILNNYIHQVSGSFYWPNVQSVYAGPHCNGGIALNVTGSSGTDKFDNVLIEGNTVSHSGRTGIVVWDNVWNGTDYASTNVKIRKNTVEFIDSDGILTFGCNGALIEYNTANTCGNYAEKGMFNGSAAIWPTRGSNCIVQYNEAYNTRALLDNIDGEGFDVDIDATDCIVQYNYSHDNAGGFLVIVNAKGSPGVYLGTTGTIVRYNISQNDGTRVINIAGGIGKNTAIYNNTFYVGSGNSTNIIEHSWDIDMTQPLSFMNNIICNFGDGKFDIPGTLSGNTTFNYNLYFGNHPESEPKEINKLTGDPLFVNPGSGTSGINSLDGYKLKSGSPAIASGILMGNASKRDFWGNQISATSIPNRGAYGGVGLNP